MRVGFFKSSRNAAIDLPVGKETFQRAIAKERDRSDRSSQTYSLLILTLAIQSEADARMVEAIKTIRDRIRTIDEIGWYAENQLGILLPLTSMAGADRLADDICDIITDHLQPDEYLACELFSYDPEKVPASEMPLWKKNMAQ